LGYLAASDPDRVQLIQFPEAEIVQTWEAVTARWELRSLGWLDGGKKITWGYRHGQNVYDFESNTKWWVSYGLMDHSWGPSGLFWLGEKGMIATSDGDSRMRFWKA
jgi:hypothetical protein